MAVLVFLLLVTLGLVRVNADSVSDLDNPEAWKNRMDNNGYEKRSSGSSSSSSDDSSHRNMFKYWKKLNDCVCNLDSCQSEVTDLSEALVIAKENCPADFSELEEMCESVSDQGYKIISTEGLSMCIKIVTSDDDGYDSSIETYKIAKLACESDGGRLVVLDTILRNALVQQEVHSIGDAGSFLMIGGRYIRADDEFVWVHDNSSFTFSDIAFMGKSHLNCVYLQETYQYRWAKNSCTDHTRGYICEIAP